MATDNGQTSSVFDAPKQVLGSRRAPYGKNTEPRVLALLCVELREAAEFRAALVLLEERCEWAYDVVMGLVDFKPDTQRFLRAIRRLELARLEIARYKAYMSSAYSDTVRSMLAPYARHAFETSIDLGYAGPDQAFIAQQHSAGVRAAMKLLVGNTSRSKASNRGKKSERKVAQAA